MQKEQPNEVIFTAPTKGIEASPYIGAADVRNLDIKSIPGAALLSLAAAKKSGTTIDSSPLWAVARNDSHVTVYVLSANGKVWKADDTTAYATWAQVTGNTTTSSHGNGLAIWKGYLIVARDTALDSFDFTSTWTNAIATLNSDTLYHPILSSVDQSLYIGSGRYVDRVVENGTFDGTSSTITFTSKAITLPNEFRIKCVEELGVNILLGTWVGTSETEKLKIGKIYPYSRSSLTLGLPIDLRETGINQMLAVNNQVYVQAGITGKWYKTDGSSFSFLTQIPQNLRALRSTLALPGAIGYWKNRILSGIVVGGAGTGYSGVWSFNLDGTGLSLENTISATNGTDGNVAIGCLLPLSLSGTNEDYLIGWLSSTDAAQGMDLVGEDGTVASYGGYFDTPLKSVGLSLENKTYTKLEVYLEQALVSGSGVKVSYRIDTSASYTLLGTYDFTSEGGVTSFNHGISITKSEQLQMRVALTGTTSPRFKYLRLYG